MHVPGYEKLEDHHPDAIKVLNAFSHGHLSPVIYRVILSPDVEAKHAVAKLQNGGIIQGFHGTAFVCGLDLEPPHLAKRKYIAPCAIHGCSVCSITRQGFKMIYQRSGGKWNDV